MDCAVMAGSHIIRNQRRPEGLSLRGACWSCDNRRVMARKFGRIVYFSTLKCRVTNVGGDPKLGGVAPLKRWRGTLPNDPEGRAYRSRENSSEDAALGTRNVRALLLPDDYAGPDRVTEDHVLSILAARRGREASFGRELFADPAWDMLLELYAAKLGRRRMSFQDLTRSIDIPPSTVARWLAALERREMVVSSTDAGRDWVDLSSDGVAAMRRLLDYWGAAFRSI